MTYSARWVSGGSPSKVFDDNGTIFLEHGSLKDTKAEFLSVEGFQRTLNVFNFRRNANYAALSTVDVWELSSFLLELGKIQLGTKAGLQSFVSTFGLDCFYTVTDGNVWEQHRQLFAIIRMLCPLRFAAFDGRHRYALCCYFATGRFYPTQDCVPNEKTFEAVAGDMNQPMDDGAHDIAFIREVRVVLGATSDLCLARCIESHDI